MRVRRAAEISAQVFTARDAMLRDTDEDLRVAFLLFDSAAETLMVRSTQMDLQEGIYRRPDPRYHFGDAGIQIDLNDLHQRANVEAGGGSAWFWLSDSQRQSIERDFGTKARYLAWTGRIPVEYTAALMRLHVYRNEMYHREESRPDALRIVAHIYAWLVAELLDRLGPGWIAQHSDDPVDLVQRTYARAGLPVPGSGAWFNIDIQKDLAGALRRGLRLEDAPALLAEYVKNRVERVHEALSSSGESLAAMRNLGQLTEMQVVRLLYAKQRLVNLRDAPTRGVPVTRAKLAMWDSWHVKLRGLPDSLAAFRSLAEFETDFEPFEAKALNMERDINLEIDRRIDLARGK